MTAPQNQPAPAAARHQAPPIYRFAAFELQPHERRLLAAGDPVPLSPRAFDVLVVLAARAGELVTKDELLERVWPGLVVEENNLQVQVSAIRKLLGSEAIATVAGRGYRFTLPVAQTSAASAPRRGLGMLPRPLTSFIGHDATLAAGVQALERTRLLTLTGIGGCGKTRIATELARMLCVSFADGVCFLDVSTVTDPERLGIALAGALEVREQPGIELQDALRANVASRHLLLVLDNCEHLLDACASWVEQLLGAGPQMRVLVTSREPLGITGERIVRVPSLTLPASGEADPDALRRSDAVRLFIDRAEQVAPDFALTRENAAAVAEICRRLDGIPLAIELAAARVKVLAPEQIRAKLDDRFRLLTGGARALPRHQTLFAVLKWSYDHLAPDEQRLLEDLAVFAGGGTLGSITAVAGERADELEVLDRLQHLLDKSLVVVDRDAPAGSRYRLLETVRQYAHERLCDRGGHAGAWERHLTYFQALAELWHANYMTERMREWVARMDGELANLLAAHAYCDHAADGARRGLQLATALRWYWLHHGLFALGQQVYERALARPGAEERSMDRAQALFAFAQHHYFQWRLVEVVAPLAEALAIAREHRDAEWIGLCLMRLGTVRAWLGSVGEARTHVQEALAIAERLDSPRLIAHACSGVGEVCRAVNDWEGAAAAYERALRLHDPASFVNLHSTYLNLARVAMAQQAFGRAREMLARSIATLREMGPTHHGHYALYVASRFAALQGDWQRAARFRGAADAAVEERGGVAEEQDENLAPSLRERLRGLGVDPAYAAAYAQGRRYSLEAALEEVVAWLDDSSEPTLVATSALRAPHPSQPQRA